jgi:hypothetical protein
MAAANKAKVSQQISWSGLALSGLVVMQVATVLWVGQGLRAVSRRRRVLLAHEEWQAVKALIGSVMPGSDVVTNREEGFVAAAGLTRYHRPDCLFVEGRTSAMARTIAEHEDAGLRACEMCRP